MFTPEELPAGHQAPSFLRGFVSGLGGQVFYLALSFPASVLLARILGPAGKGAVDLALLIPYMVMLFVSLGLTSSGSYLVGTRRYPTEDIVGSLIGMWSVVAGCTFPLYMLAAVYGWLSPLAPGVSPSLMLVGGLSIPFTLARQYLGSILLGRQQFVAYNSLPVVLAAGNLAGILILVLALGQGPIGAAFSSVAAHFLCLIYLLMLLREFARRKLRWNGTMVREAVSYGLRGQIGNILQFFNYRLDVIVLGHFRGVREVGLYTLAVGLAEFLWYIPNASALVVFPKTASSKDDANHLTQIVFRITLWVSLLGAAGLGFLIRPIIFRIYGTAFGESVVPFFLLLPGVVFLGGAKILSADLSGRGRPEFNAIGSCISLVVTIALDLLLIPDHGASGAAVASSVAYFTTLVYVAVVYLQVVRAKPSVLFRFDRADFLTLKESLRRFGTGSFK